MSLFSRWLQRAPTPINNEGLWRTIISEPFAGAWQRNKEWTRDGVLAHHAVFTCITLIAGDIGKMRPGLVKRGEHGVWTKHTDPNYTGLLLRPNRYQNHVQFKEYWTNSKLITGNTYALKETDGSGIVRALYILDPRCVQPLVAPDGSVFYRLKSDKLNTIPEDDRTVPASFIIHDRMNCLFHPLVGVSPLFAAGMSAHGGLEMIRSNSAFFEQDANPGGIITVPGAISQDKSDELQEKWDSKHKGSGNKGKVAVLSGGVKFQPLRMASTDAQLIEQMEWSAKVVASTFKVPPWKIGIEQLPASQKVNEQNQIYYSDCLQILIEQYEAAIDEGLGFEGTDIGLELDLDDLIRMDQPTMVRTMGEGAKAGILAANEGRRRLNLPPVEGGDTPYLQQQNWSLADLAARSEQENDHEIQSSALQGNQISALQALISAAASGSVPVDTVSATIAASFPLITAAQIEAMLSPLMGVEQSEPPPDPDITENALSALERARPEDMTRA